MNTINEKDVRVVWRSNWYDGTLIDGHCWYNQEYCYIKSNGPWSRVIEFRVYRLEGQDLVNELAHRKLFEDIVGYHATQNVKECGCQQGFDHKIYYDRYKHLVPEIDISKLTCLGGWDIDNAEHCDEED